MLVVYRKRVNPSFFCLCDCQESLKITFTSYGVQRGENFESVVKLWICNKKFYIMNIVTSAVCWSIWKLRNSICFQDVAWLGMHMI
jgi:hypothetical protein